MITRSPSMTCHSTGKVMPETDAIVTVIQSRIASRPRKVPIACSTYRASSVN